MAIKDVLSKLSIQGHYRRFQEGLEGLTDDQLMQLRQKYDHLAQTDLTITGLGLTAAGLGAKALAQTVPPETLAYAAGPTALAISLIGPTRGIVREEEKTIIEEQIAKRHLTHPPA